MAFSGNTNKKPMVSYQGFTFEKFYEIMIHLPFVNEDVARIIYHYSTPQFFKNNQCILKHMNSTHSQKVSIRDVFFSNIILKYCYSYETNRAVCFYAIEDELRKEEAET